MNPSCELRLENTVGIGETSIERFKVDSWWTLTCARFSEDALSPLRNQRTQHRCSLSIGSFQVLRVSASAPGCFPQEKERELTSTPVREPLVWGYSLYEHWHSGVKKEDDERRLLIHLHTLGRGTNTTDPVEDITQDPLGETLNSFWLSIKFSEKPSIFWHNSTQ